MEDDNHIFANFQKIFDVDGNHDLYAAANISLTIGVVVDTDDPMQAGRLRVFCATLNDDVRKAQHLPWAAYVSPFGGVINNPCFTRGSDPDNCKTEGSVHYGFWGIPEQGAHVLVGCVDGDPRRRFWMGCFPSQQETHTLFNGRYKWNSANGTPDGPLSSADQPIQPLYANLSKAFNSDRKSREWKTRGADYQATAVDADVAQVPNNKSETYLDEQNEQISNAEPDAWVKDALGAHGYDWTNLKNLGAFLSSKVYGMTTPGLHTLMMDDRPFNNRVKLRSSSGHVLLLDDTNERIYIATNEGNCWVEMDSSGNIDIYAKRRLSVHSEKDINFSTDESFRVKAKKGIYMYAGDTPGTLGGDIPPDGQIRLHSSHDFHLYSDGNIRQYAGQNILIESEQDINVTCTNWLQEASINIKMKGTQSIEQTSDGNIKSAVGNGKIQVDNNGIIADAGGSRFQVDPTSISSSAAADVYFSAPAAQGSITSINSSFIAKQNGSGSPMQTAAGPAIPSVTVSDITVNPSETEISVWTNRVPTHEPWPRVMKQGTDKPQNQTNDGYKNNAAWVDQYDNSSSSAGSEPIGKVEGDEIIERGIFWRR